MADVVEEVEELKGHGDDWGTDKDDVFDEPTEKVEAKAEVAEEEVKATEDKATEDETTDKVDDVEEGVTTDPKDKEIAGLKAGIKAERQKRQQAEALNKSEEKAPDAALDPDGFAQHNARQSAAIALRSKIELSQDLARDAYKDYDEKEAVFMDLCSEVNGEGDLVVTDSALHEKWMASANPAKFAYQHAQKHLKFVEVNSDEFESNQEKLIEAKAQERVKQLLKERGLEAPDLPDLTNAAASESNTEELLPKGDEDNDMFP